MDEKIYQKSRIDTEELYRNQLNKEALRMKEHNVRLMQVIGFLISIGFGFLSWYVKGVSATIEKFILSINTLEIHRVLSDKEIDELKQRVKEIESQRISR